VQWTRLPGGQPSLTFVERIRRLLSSETASAPGRVHSADSAPSPLIRRPIGLLYGATAVVVLLALGYFGLERLNRSKLTVPGAASIAVLPLNGSGWRSQWYSDGIWRI
jgi:hypothetical protein